MTTRLAALGIAMLLAVLVPREGWGAPPAVLPLAPPPPDLVGLLEFVEVPLDKPPVPIPAVPLPATVASLEGPPPAPITLPADKPTAALPPSRMLACAGTWLGVASESLECGVSRLNERKYDEAARAFEQAARLGARDRQDVVRAATYWLGESYWLLGRTELADQAFTRLAQTPGRDGFDVWALANSGWTALRLGDFARARETFARLLAGRPSYPLDAYGRFGLALSLYGLGQYEEAQRAWADAIAQRLTVPLTRDAAFWNGDTLARVKQYDRASTELERFVRGGAHPLLGSGLMRLGWSLLAEKKYAQAAARLREAQKLPVGGGLPDEQDWKAAGLALALLGTKDLDGARTAARAIGQRSKLAEAVSLRLLEALVDARRGPDADALAQQLLAGTLEPETRGRVLFLKGESARASGNVDDARTQYDLVRTTAPNSEIARYATFRLALANFEFREFAQAAQDSAQVAASATAPDLRDAALLLQAEAAYAAGEYAAAEAAYERLLAQASQHPQGSLLRLSRAWTALRRDQRDEARRRFLEFAAQYPIDPRRPDALVLAAELALRAGDLAAARQILDRVIDEHPTSPRTPFARLNRGIVRAQTGDLPGAQREITDWLGRSPFPPLVGRARLALGSVYLSSGRPGDAAREFTAARAEGAGALAALGLGAAALAEGRVDEAERELKEASASGTAAVAARADYGLAVVAFQRGDTAGFKNVASQALGAAPSGPMAPRLLYVLTGLAVQEKDWGGAMGNARRLASQFKDADVADDALERIVEGAADAKAWPAVSEAYQLLRQQYPRSPFVEASRARFAEAELESGRADVARRELESVPGQQSPAAAGSALVVLGRAREATGDRAGAVDAYSRAAQAGATGAGAGSLQQARLLLDEKKWGEARGVVEPLMKGSDAGEVAQAAQALGRSYQGEGNHQAATEYFMTAAYLAPESPAGRQAMLGAARSLAALKQPDSAAIVYRKLLAQSALPADVADAARQGLAALGRP